MEKIPKVVETLKVVEASKEAKVSKVDVSSKVADPCVVAKTTTGRAEKEAGQGRRSLLQLPRTAVKSVSTLMVSALQSGWRMCSWKVSAISTLSPVAAPHPLLPPMIHSQHVKWYGHSGKMVWSVLRKHAIIMWPSNYTGAFIPEK